MNSVSDCSECGYIKMYHYEKKIYYCDHPDRADDMGKLSADHLPKASPVWCPLRNNENKQYRTAALWPKFDREI